MRNGIRNVFVAGLFTWFAIGVACGPIEAQGPIISDCTCGLSDCPNCCQACRPKCQRRICRKCPKCENDVCRLIAECVPEEQTCFSVEQKLVCVPPVSLPWRQCDYQCQDSCESKCRKKCAKTKMVKVLKSETYECNVCKYSWRVIEPVITQPEPTPTPILEPSVEPANAGQMNNGQVPPPLFIRPLFDPSGSDVPKPPDDK